MDGEQMVAEGPPLDGVLDYVGRATGAPINAPDALRSWVALSLALRPRGERLFVVSIRDTTNPERWIATVATGEHQFDAASRCASQLMAFDGQRGPFRTNTYNCGDCSSPAADRRAMAHLKQLAAAGATLFGPLAVIAATSQQPQSN